LEESLQSRLDRLRDNRTSGAVGLAIEALDLAADWIVSEWAIEEFVGALETMHPAIATVRNVAGEIRCCSGEPAKRIDQLRGSLRNGNRIIAKKVAALIPPGSVVITLSNSSTVRDALIAIGARGVYVMESNPGREGAAMADALRDALDATVGRERVELIPDDSIGQYAPHCDCALVGVDSFDASGAIWHKTGTLLLAKLCRALGKPFYVAGHTLKRSSRELGDDPPKDPETGLQFFDRTPGNLITLLITESS
jgi:translation initiation factor 2B subunit (eIF-2B alpha/beta/delta family)